MAIGDEEISAAIERRRRFARRMRGGESPEQRLARFVQLQRKLLELLRTSPRGWHHFVRRNLQSRRVEEIDGQWRPVSPDR
ncbi:MAG: hypothetical protein ACYC6Y_12190 [Thermoguttaceae bacterium]